MFMWSLVKELLCSRAGMDAGLGLHVKRSRFHFASQCCCKSYEAGRVGVLANSTSEVTVLFTRPCCRQSPRPLGVYIQVS